MRPGSIGEVGRLIDIVNAQQIIIATYADPCSAILHTRVPLPEWPNAAANEAHYFGPIDQSPDKGT